MIEGLLKEMAISIVGSFLCHRILNVLLVGGDQEEIKEYGEELVKKVYAEEFFSVFLIYFCSLPDG